MESELDYPTPHIPREMLNLIPEYNGNTKTLSLFLRKCEFVISKYQGAANVNEFLLQSVTSKLSGKAAALISERGEFQTYDEIKAILIQHFGDPRSEECVAIELETLKIRNNESYLEFCGRIQDVRAILISKVNQSSSVTLKEAKRIIYDNTALNVFLYNLPEHMVRIVRIKNPTTLEQALSFVLEEVNFQEQYNLRSKMLQNRPSITQQNIFKPSIPQNTQFKFGIPAFPTNQFKFGIPGNTHNLFRPNNQYFGNRPLNTNAFNQPRPTAPQFNNFTKPQFNTNTPFQPTGYRPQIGQFGYRPQTQGFRPQPGQFGFRPQQQHQGYRPPNFSNDVSMRTAPAKPQQFPVNEISTDETDYYNYPYNYETEFDENMYAYYNENAYTEQYPDPCEIESDNNPQLENNQEKVDSNENFQVNCLRIIPR